MKTHTISRRVGGKIVTEKYIMQNGKKVPVTAKRVGNLSVMKVGKVSLPKEPCSCPSGGSASSQLKQALTAREPIRFRTQPAKLPMEGSNVGGMVNPLSAIVSVPRPGAKNTEDILKDIRAVLGKFKPPKAKHGGAIRMI